MFKNKAILLLASALLAMPGAIHAQGVTPTAAGKGGTVSADQLVQRYVTLAGGPANAKSLVNGLRTGADITLVGAATADEPIYETRPIYEDRPVYQTVPIYETQPVYETQQVQVQVGTGLCALPKIGMCPIYQTQTQQVQTGTQQVQVGTQQVQTGTQRVQIGTEQVQVGTKPGKPSTVTFSPGAAAPMGFGNVDIALALTEARLRSTVTPSPTQLRDALLEILQKRAGGAGWGEIANAYGFQLK